MTLLMMMLGSFDHDFLSLFSRVGWNCFFFPANVPGEGVWESLVAPPLSSCVSLARTISLACVLVLTKKDLNTYKRNLTSCLYSSLLCVCLGLFCMYLGLFSRCLIFFCLKKCILCVCKSLFCEFWSLLDTFRSLSSLSCEYVYFVHI